MSPRIGFGGNRLRKGKSHQKTTSSKVKSPPELSYETQLRQFKDSIDTSNKPSPGNVPFDIPATSHREFLAWAVLRPPIPTATVVSALEIMDRAAFDRMTKEDRAYDLYRSNHQQAELLQKECKNLWMNCVNLQKLIICVLD